MIQLFHLSDFHLVNHSCWQNMKETIRNTLRERCGQLSKGEKFLVITGDFHNFIDTDYKESLTWIPELAEAMRIDIKEDVFVVPGNHDICRPADEEEKETHEALALTARSNPNKLEKTIFVNMLLKDFEAFNRFCKDLGLCDADENPAGVRVKKWRNKLNILHLNTALAADGSDKHNQVVDIQRVTSEEIRVQLDRNLPTIALGHNSYYDLHEYIQIPLYTMFAQENIRAYLCGDQHKVDSGRDTKRILGKEYGSISIPNIICPRSSADVNDSYSDFGFYVHKWDDSTGIVNLELLRWSKNSGSTMQSVADQSPAYYMVEPQSPSGSQSGSVHSLAPNAEETRLLEQYRTYLRTHCTEIDLNGLPSDLDDISRRYTLDQIFVPLSFENTAPKHPPRSTMNFSAHTFWEDGEKDNFRLRDLIPQEGVFRKLILGVPGAGKTTLFKLLASYYAVPNPPSIEGVELTQRELFPIWIRCRDIRGTKVSIQEVIRNLVPLSESRIHLGDEDLFYSYVHKHIEAGTALLLIDGLDEIRDPQGRSDFVDQLHTFINQYENVNVLISSREKGFEVVTHRAFDSFSRWRIRDLDPEDVISLCVRWEGIVSKGDPRHEEEGTLLGEQITKDSRLKRLVRNPLLLTTLLLVKRRVGRLPSKRVKLYKEAVGVLLDSWNTHQHERVEVDAAKNKLAYIAFYMATNRTKSGSSRTQITKTELRQLLTEVRSQKTTELYVMEDTNSPADFIDIVEKRSGLLIKIGEQEDGEALYEFQHQSFQEYLAAYGAHSGCYPGAEEDCRGGRVLDQYIEDPNMKEILLLGAAMDPRCGEALVKNALHIGSNSCVQSFLIGIIEDEVTLSSDAAIKVFDVILRNPYSKNLYSKYEQFFAGSYREFLRTYFFERDCREYEGYPICQSITDFYTDKEQVSTKSIMDHLQSNDPKTIIQGVCQSILNCTNQPFGDRDFDEGFKYISNHCLNHKNPYIHFVATLAFGEIALHYKPLPAVPYISALIRVLNDNIPYLGDWSSAELIISLSHSPNFTMKNKFPKFSDKGIQNLQNSALLSCSKFVIGCCAKIDHSELVKLYVDWYRSLEQTLIGSDSYKELTVFHPEQEFFSSKEMKHAFAYSKDICEKLFGEEKLFDKLSIADQWISFHHLSLFQDVNTILGKIISDERIGIMNEYIIDHWISPNLLKE